MWRCSVKKKFAACYKVQFKVQSIVQSIVQSKGQSIFSICRSKTKVDSCETIDHSESLIVLRPIGKECSEVGFPELATREGGEGSQGLQSFPSWSTLPASPLLRLHVTQESQILLPESLVHIAGAVIPLHQRCDARCMIIKNSNFSFQSSPRQARLFWWPSVLSSLPCHASCSARVPRYEEQPTHHMGTVGQDVCSPGHTAESCCCVSAEDIKF